MSERALPTPLPHGLPRLLAQLRHALPKGRTLPENVWQARHHALLVLLSLQAVGLPIFALFEGSTPLHALAHGAPLAVFAALGYRLRHRRRVAATLVSAGLISSSALLVHSWDGVIEGHFHFFVMIVVLALYEDWVPFLLAAAYVVVHHGLMGALDPSGVYNHPDAIAHPWKWAAIHGGFVGAAGLASVVAWRLNEMARREAAKANRQASESEERFRGAFDEAPIGMVLARVDSEKGGSLLQVNRAMCDITGYREEELLEKSLSDLCHPAEPHGFAPLEALLAGELDRCEFETRYVRENGAAAWALVHGSAMRESSAEAHAIAQVQDVTERKEGEELLEHQRKQLADAQSVARLGSWEWEVTTDSVEWSDELCRIYGLEPGNHPATFEDFLERVHPDDRANVKAGIEAAYASGDPFVFEHRILRPDGSARVTEARGEVVMGEDGRPLRMFGTGQDITEQKEAEEAAFHLAAIVDSSEEAIVGVTLDGIVVSWNRGAEKMYGYGGDEAIGRSLAMLLPPDQPDQIPGILKRLGRGEKVERLETVRQRKDGSPVHVALTISPVTNAAGQLTGASTIARDISARKLRERYLEVQHEATVVLAESRTTEEALPALLRTIGEGMGWPVGAFWLPHGEPPSELRCATFWHGRPQPPRAFEATSRRIGLARGEGIPGRVWETGEARWVPDVTVEPDSRRTQPALDDGLHACMLLPVTSGGEVLGVVEFLADEIRSPDPTLLEVLDALSGQIGHFLERRAAERTIRAAEERFRGAFEEAPIGMALLDLDGRFEQVNAALCEITGYSRDQLEATSLESVTHPDDVGADRVEMERILAGEAPSYKAEKRYVHASGHPVWAALQATLLRDPSGRPAHFLVQLLDITDRRRYEEQLQYMADHDPLTGLLNRRSFERELESHARRVGRYGSEGAVLLLDLDHFKYVNDSLGHNAGDELIVRVASALGARLRETDVLARLGGDEFAVLLPKAGAEGAAKVADELLAAVREQAVQTQDGRPRAITASVGIAMLDDQEGLAGEDIMVNADLAMYDAKEAGRDRIAFSSSEEFAHARMKGRMNWVERIRGALEEDRFTLLAQPIVDLSTGRAAQHELLLRMRDTTGDLIPPGAFLYIAERLDLIQEIDRWVVKSAIAILERQERDGQEVTLEVNLSGRSLGDSELLELIESELRRSRIAPERLIFEVTETAAVAKIPTARRFGERLSELGCRFALDDFGAGFGSFYYLKHLPFDFLKIDGEFVRNCRHSHTDRLLIQAVVDIARGLGKQTIAEFVSDDETVRLLTRLGVDHGQGFHLGRPLPLEEALGGGAAGRRDPARAAGERGG